MYAFPTGCRRCALRVRAKKQDCHRRQSCFFGSSAVFDAFQIPCNWQTKEALIKSDAHEGMDLFPSYCTKNPCLASASRQIFCTICRKNLSSPRTPRFNQRFPKHDGHADYAIMCSVPPPSVTWKNTGCSCSEMLGLCSVRRRSPLRSRNSMPCPPSFVNSGGS